MELMNQLFIEFPNLFAIIDELHHYSKQSVIPVDMILTEGGIPLARSTPYPTITLINTALNMVLDLLPSISYSFMIMMMEKHRSGMIFIKNVTPCKEFYCRLFYYIIGIHYYIAELKLFPKTPHHEKTTLTASALEFLLIIQESDSPLVGMSRYPH